MAIRSKSGKLSRTAKASQVECVPLPNQRMRRRSKHSILTQEILGELTKLGNNSAVKVQLCGIPAKTLRSAVFRAAFAADLEIATFSDHDHLYILKKSTSRRVAVRDGSVGKDK